MNWSMSTCSTHRVTPHSRLSGTRSARYLISVATLGSILTTRGSLADRGRLCRLCALNRDKAEPPCAGLATNSEGAGLDGFELGRKPPLQRVGAEILLDDQVCRAAWCQTGQPPQEQLVQGGFADPDRRVGPDAVEPDVGRHLVRGHGMELADSQRSG